MATTNYEDALDAITFGITSLTSHNNDNDIRSSLSSGLKSSLSSSSSTSSTSSAAASLSSTGSANHNGFHGKPPGLPKNAVPARSQQQVKHLNGNTPTNTTNNLTCPLCKKTLASPKVLNCLHVFCKQCLLIEMQTVSEFGDYNPSFINCPKCKQETMVRKQVYIFITITRYTYLFEIISGN